MHGYKLAQKEGIDMNFEFTEREKEHERIMEKLAVPCRSDKFGFIQEKTQRIDAIRQELVGGKYKEILLPCAQLWREDYEAPIDVIISAHVDTVKEITKCSSSLSEKGYYKGTYDNQGTASALLVAMLEGKLPKNVLVAFTGEEETGRCVGAKQALEFAKAHKQNPVCIALDVTYEGYDEGSLFSIENLTSGHKKDEDQEFLDEIGEIGLSLENETEEPTFRFVRLHKSAIPSNLPKDYQSKDSGWFDEAQSYGKQGAKALSLCLPFSGNMHGNSGGKVREPVFEGFINAIAGFAHSLAKDGDKEIVEDLAKENKSFFLLVKEMITEEKEERKKERESYGYSWNGLSFPKYSKRSEEYDSMTEDEYYEYLAYNYGYGGYNEYNNYVYGNGENVQMFPTFDPNEYDWDEYTQEIVDELYEYASDYQENPELFVSDCLDNLPSDFSNAFDFEVLTDMLENIWKDCNGEYYADINDAYRDIEEWEQEQENESTSMCDAETMIEEDEENNDYY